MPDIETSYDRPAVSTYHDKIAIRGSQATSCGRQLWYSGMEIPQTDEMTPETAMRLKMGNILEPVIIEALKMDRGWIVTSWQELLEGNLNLKFMEIFVPKIVTVPVNDEIVMTGTPDAIGTIDDDERLPFAIEIKTRNAEQYRRTVSQGAMVSHYSAVVQLAIYRAGLTDLDLVHPDSDSALVTLNKDNGEIYVEWFRPEVLEDVLVDIGDRLSTWTQVVLTSDTPPAKDYEPRDWQCKSCPWRTECGNIETMEDTEIHLGKEIVTEDEVMDAFDIWEINKMTEDNAKKDSEQDKYTRALLTRYLLGLGVDKVRLAGKTFAWNVSYIDRPKQKVNVEKVRYYLSKEQIEDCITYEGEPYIEIRRGKKA